MMISNSTEQCPSCGRQTRSDGAFKISNGRTEVISAIWLAEFERRLRNEHITKKDGKRILRKIRSARDLRTLPASLQSINPVVAEATKEVIEKSPSSKVMRWLHGIGLIVGIVAGLNSLSDEYNIDAAVEWLKLNLNHEIQQKGDPAADEKTFSKPPGKDMKGLR